MLEEPEHWRKYYKGEPSQLAFSRAYSYSDRSRYYWPRSEVQHALERLLANLSASTIPLSLLSQYMPGQYEAVRSGIISSPPRELILNKIREVTGLYARACGIHGE